MARLGFKALYKTAGAWSLALRVLWAPTATLGIALLLLLSNPRPTAPDVLTPASEAMTTFTLPIDRLRERHNATLKQAEGFVGEVSAGQGNGPTAPTLEPSAYRSDIDARIKDYRRLLGGYGGAHDTRRVMQVLDDVARQSTVVGALLESIALAKDPDNNSAALLADSERELLRADRDMQQLLIAWDKQAQSLAASVLASQHSASPATAKPMAALFLLPAIPMALLIALLALGQYAASAKQVSLANAAQALAQDAQLTERTREIDRLSQQTRRTERELLLDRLYIDNLMGSLRAAVIVTDAVLTIRTLNRAARQSLGITDEQGSFLQTEIASALAPQLGDPKAALTTAIAERQTRRFENVAFGKSGQLFDVTVGVYLDETGAGRGLIVVADDVSEQVRTKNQLLVAERLAAVGRLSAQVAHEVRNPLSAIGLNAELLGEDLVDGLQEPKRGEAKLLLASIAHEIERLTQVTESYLRLTKLPQPALQSLDVNQLVSELSALLREELRLANIEIDLRLATPAPTTSGDPGQLRQALLNIVRNAREAMPTGGTIEISTGIDGTGETPIFVKVTDNGPGIAEQVLPRIFEPFFSTKASGTGLGLAITQQIVAEHRGHLRAQNRPQGHGLEMTLELPPAPTPRAIIDT